MDTIRNVCAVLSFIFVVGYVNGTDCPNPSKWSCLYLYTKTTQMYV